MRVGRKSFNSSEEYWVEHLQDSSLSVGKAQHKDPSAVQEVTCVL